MATKEELKAAVSEVSTQIFAEILQALEACLDELDANLSEE